MAAGPLPAQQPAQPVTRAQAVAAALTRGAPAAFGRADTAAAAGALRAARLYPNPSLAASYTKDVPHYHLLADVALDLPWLRAARGTRRATASRSDAPRSDSTWIPLIRGHSPRSPTRGCRVARRATPTACSGW